MKKKINSIVNYFQFIPVKGETVSNFCYRIIDSLDEYSQIVKATCFGTLKYHAEFENTFRSMTKGEYPITWIDGDNYTESFMNGIQLWVVENSTFLTQNYTVGNINKYIK